MCDATKKDKNMTVAILSLLNSVWTEEFNGNAKVLLFRKFIYNRTWWLQRNWNGSAFEWSKSNYTLISSAITNYLG